MASETAATVSGVGPPSSREAAAVPGSRLERHLPADLLAACIHCGFCLPTCPTYALTGNEISSPRGRLALMGAVAAGELELTPTFEREMYFCLDCRACETACPAAVRYGRLVEGARALLEERRPSPLRRGVLRALFESPRRLDSVAGMLRPWSRSSLRRRLAPLLARTAPRLAWTESLLPPLRRPRPLPEIVPAHSHGKPGRMGGAARRVALLEGCVQRHTHPEVNADTATVLARNGIEVRVPRRQGCCGSLHAHGGDLAGARRLARRNLEAFETAGEVDAVVVNAAGCSSFLKHLEQAFEPSDPDRARAAAFAGRVRDATEYLAEIGWEAPAGAVHARVTYHDPCHLVHGQGVAAAPREILTSIPGVELVPLEEASWCCGSAGTYNLTHPEASRALLERKLDHVEATGASILCTANPGCFVQLAAGLRRRGLDVELAHPLTLLARAYEPEPDARSGAGRPTGRTAAPHVGGGRDRWGVRPIS
ncbi:MAG: (Fe-S)-binding protein [Gemmatimonadota bacterium]